MAERLNPEHFDACLKNGETLGEYDQTGLDYRWAAVSKLRLRGLHYQDEDLADIRMELLAINARRKIVVTLNCDAAVFRQMAAHE